MTGKKLMLIVRAGRPVIFFLSALVFCAGCGAEQKSVELSRIDTQETRDQIDPDETSRLSIADPAVSDSSVVVAGDSALSMPDSIMVPIGMPQHLVLQGEVSTTSFRAGYSFPAATLMTVKIMETLVLDTNLVPSALR